MFAELERTNVKWYLSFFPKYVFKPCNRNNSNYIVCNAFFYAIEFAVYLHNLKISENGINLKSVIINS